MSGVRITIEAVCASCGESTIAYNDTQTPLCVTCENALAKSKVIVLTIELNAAVRAELSARTYGPKYFPNPYFKQGFGGIIDFTPFVARAKAS